MRILFYVDIIDSGIFPVSCIRILYHVDMVGIVVLLGCKSARAIFFVNFMFLEKWNYLYTLSCIYAWFGYGFLCGGK